MMTNIKFSHSENEIRSAIEDVTNEISGYISKFYNDTRQGSLKIIRENIRSNISNKMSILDLKYSEGLVGIVEWAALKQYEALDFDISREKIDADIIYSDVVNHPNISVNN